jgi:hypothetical protein
VAILHLHLCREMDGESSVLQQLARKPEHPTFKKKPQRWGWGFSSPP